MWHTLFCIPFQWTKLVGLCLFLNVLHFYLKFNLCSYDVSLIYSRFKDQKKPSFFRSFILPGSDRGKSCFGNMMSKQTLGIQIQIQMVVQRIIPVFSGLQWLPRSNIESDIRWSFSTNTTFDALSGQTHSPSEMLLQLVQIESNLAFTDNLPISVCKNCLMDRSRSWLWGHSASLSLPRSLFALTHLHFNTPTHDADCDPFPSALARTGSGSAWPHVFCGHASDLTARPEHTPDSHDFCRRVFTNASQQFVYLIVRSQKSVSLLVTVIHRLWQKQSVHSSCP